MLKIARPKRSLSIRNGPPRRSGNDVKKLSPRSHPLNGPHQLALADLRIWSEHSQSVLLLEALVP